MAGAYPDVPSNRMAYDRDGTQVYLIDALNAISQLTSIQAQGLNDENDTSPLTVYGQGSKGSLLFYFSELRDFAGFFIADANVPGWNPGALGIAVSSDTTNGLDGTWTTIASDVHPVGPTRPTYRTGIASVARFGIRAVRISGSVGAPSMGFQPCAIHLYGNIAAGQNTKRLAIWHPTLDQHVTGAYFDWGNAPRSSSADRPFRIKNLSPTLTANDINISVDATTDTTPSVPAQHLLSTDAATFTGAIAVSTLPPGGISSVLTLRRNTPSNATLSVWAVRLLAQATSWS